MKRKKSQSVIDRNQILLDQIKALKTDHPLWGYRRIWAYLKYRQGVAVNKKRIYRLMKEAGYLVTKNYKLKAKRDPDGDLGLALSRRGPRLVHQGDCRLLPRASVQD